MKENKFNIKNIKINLQDIIIPKIIDYDLYRLKKKELELNYLTKEIINENKERKVLLFDKKKGSKYCIVDIVESFHKNKEDINNEPLLLFLEDNNNFIKIIFANTIKPYDIRNYTEYIVKKKDNKYIKEDISSLDFLFKYYLVPNQKIQVISETEVDFLKDRDVKYLKKDEIEKMFKDIKPILTIQNNILFKFISLIVFLIPISFAIAFNSSLEDSQKKKIMKNEKIMKNKLYKLKKEKERLKDKYNLAIEYIKNNKEVYYDN